MDEQRNTKRVIIHRICLFLPATTPTFFSYIAVLPIARHLARNKNSILHLYIRQPKKQNEKKKVHNEKERINFTPGKKLFPKSYLSEIVVV